MSTSDPGHFGDLSPPTTPALARLFHHRWAAPALDALCREGGGARLVTVAYRLEAAREPVRQALESLVELGLVRRNEGYGHPLRPEFLLTDPGARAAEACGRYVQVAGELGAGEVAHRKWAAATSVEALRGVRRFSELRAGLGVVTDRALTLTLRQLGGAGLMNRNVRAATPVEVEYLLTSHGGKLAEHAAEIEAALAA